MELLGHLSREQEQELLQLKEKIAHLSREQAQSCIAEIMRQVIVRDNLIDHLLEVTQISQGQYAQSILFQSNLFQSNASRRCVSSRQSPPY
ncbi:MAG: hypothetical protein ACFB16_06805 [Phormidesmis sp.]